MFALSNGVDSFYAVVAWIVFMRRMAIFGLMHVRGFDWGYDGV